MGVSRYNLLYRDRGQRSMVIGCVAIQHSQGCDTASGRAWVAIQILYHHKEEACDTRSTARAGAYNTEPRYGRLGLRHCQPGLRHGRAWPRHGRGLLRHGVTVRHDKAQCAQPGHTMRVARVSWVCTCAPNPVLDSVHCF